MGFEVTDTPEEGLFRFGKALALLLEAAET